MTESVSSGTTRPTTNSDWDTAVPSNTEPPGACLVSGPDDEFSSWTCSPSVAALVAHNKPASLEAFMRNQVSPDAIAPTNNNAQRTAATAVEGVYAHAGVTSAGDAAFVGFAGVKGHTNGANLEIVSVSAQVGFQTEVQAGVARVGLSSDVVSWELRTVEAEAHLGIHNPDGSPGLNAGAGVTAIATEFTLATSGNSVTAGVSASFGAEVSVGSRDADADGDNEYCIRAGVGPVVGGACLEPMDITAAVVDILEQTLAPFVSSN